MSEGSSSNNLGSGLLSRDLFILILVALLVPHSLGFSSSLSRNESVYSFSLLAVCWTLVRQDSYVFSEPQSSISFQLASSEALSYAMLILPLYVIVMYTQSRFMRGVTSRNIVLLVIVIAVGIQLIFMNSYVVLFATLSTHVYGTYPFPVFHILNLVSVFWRRKPKSTPLGSN